MFGCTGAWRSDAAQDPALAADRRVRLVMTDRSPLPVGLPG